MGVSVVRAHPAARSVVVAQLVEQLKSLFRFILENLWIDIILNAGIKLTMLSSTKNAFVYVN